MTKIISLCSYRAQKHQPPSPMPQPDTLLALCEAAIDQGSVHAESGEHKEAERLFRLVLSYFPNDPHALFNLGVCAQDQNRLNQAKRYYRRALKADPKLKDAAYNLATVYDREGKIKTAQRYLDLYRS